MNLQVDPACPKSLGFHEPRDPPEGPSNQFVCLEALSYRIGFRVDDINPALPIIVYKEIYHNSHSFGSLRYCRYYIINRRSSIPTVLRQKGS